MTTKPIVVATDGSEESLRAAEWAAREAALHGAPLRIVAAAELLPRMSPAAGGTGLETVADILRENRDRALNAAARCAAAATHGLVIDTDPLSGPVAQAVADSGSGALMLVVGSRGSGAFAAMILGSVSRYAATHASCPVAIIRDEAMMPHRRVGVGIRDAATSQDALAFAFEEASLRQAALTALHAWRGPTGHGTPEVAARQLTELLASWQAKYPSVQVSQEIVHGHPGHALAGLSARSDLTVLGGHASGGSAPRGPATVTHAVLSHAHGPVVTVPSSQRPEGV
ncbi:MAG TPA: universal stress protein [Trebonia sp.]|nr:universal stress protein [Trebonia sp.]